jgi:hypothetical protein
MLAKMELPGGVALILRWVTLVDSRMPFGERSPPVMPAHDVPPETGTTPAGRVRWTGQRRPDHE